MSEMRHTDGLLSIEATEETQNGLDYLIKDEQTHWVGWAYTEANARRLVAAWNACDGVSTERLEETGRLHLAVGHEFDALQQLNTELLACLEVAVPYMSSMYETLKVARDAPEVKFLEEQLAKARAAIAGARG